MEGVIYDIPLEEETEEIKPVIKHTAEMEKASLVNGSEWHERYKNAMGNAIRICLRDASRTRPEEWKVVGKDDRVFLCEKTKNLPGDYIVIKVRAILRGRADRYAYVMRDHNFETRGRWDTDIEDVKQLESYTSQEGTIFVVQSTIKNTFNNRSLLGIMFYHLTEETNTHKVIFTTAPHPYYKCNPNEVKAEATIGCFLRQLDGDAETEVIIVTYVNPGGGLMTKLYLKAYKERLRKRAYLYEQVVAKWDEYYGKNKK
jgi:hypothetical protein